MQITAGPQALNGRDLLPVGGDRQDKAAIHASAVEQHGARAALPAVAPLLSPGQVQVLAQRVEDGRAVIETEAMTGAIDTQHHRA